MWLYVNSVYLNSAIHIGAGLILLCVDTRAHMLYKDKKWYDYLFRYSTKVLGVASILLGIAYGIEIK